MSNTELNKVVEFLCGESDLDGYWFGDKKNGVGGRPLSFWWRKDLRAAVEFNEAELKQLREESERLRKLGNAISNAVADRIDHHDGNLERHEGFDFEETEIRYAEAAYIQGEISDLIRAEQRRQGK